MRAAFKRDEMISATAAAKNLGEIVADLVAHRKDKAAVVRDDEIAAVILPVDEYEYMADLVEVVEHLEIDDLITRRTRNGEDRSIPLEELLREEGIAL
ncbi:MAG: hypothetical protein AB1634_16635 [Thermodesulfobacteriota bacterium]